MRSSLLSLLLTTVMFAAQPRALRDPLGTGTTGGGPAMIVIPVTEADTGSHADDAGYTTAEMRHHVRVSPFAIGQFEVTNAELCAFLNEEGNGSDQEITWIDLRSATEIRLDGARFVPVFGAENHPATGVTWSGARAYCRWLSKKSGARYDLPTATQWEIAARAGTSTVWWWGNKDDPTRQHSVVAGTASPTDVGSYAPNPWGVYDTAGNVWEWTLDCYVPDAPLLTASQDPVILDERCATPEIRGGSYADGGEFSRPSYRANAWWSSRSPRIGFRVARRMPALVAGGPPITWRRSGKRAVVNILTDGGHTQLVDPVSGLVVFEGEMPADGVAVPEPVRVHAAIEGQDGGSPVTVRVGSGPRVAAMERWLRATGSIEKKDQRMTSALGIALPPSPLYWTDVRMNGNVFLSPWVLADDAPQIVAFDGAGRVAVRNVTLPENLEPHATIEVSSIPLQPYAVLDVTFPRPAGDLIAPMFFGVANARIDAAAAADAGRFLSVADVIDPRLFALLIAGHGCGVDPGATIRLAPMPPFTSLTLMTHEPVGVSTTPRVVQLAPGRVAAMQLTTEDEVSFRHTSSRTFRGRVSMPFGGPALAGATVVVSDYPSRRETKTDGDGRFLVDGIRSDRPVHVLVDTSATSIAAPYAATQIFRGVSPSAEANLVMSPPHTAQEVLAIPQALRASSNARHELDVVPADNDLEFPQTIGKRGGAFDDAYRFVESVDDKTAVMTTCSSSHDWQFQVATGPFQLYRGNGPITTPVDEPGRCPAECNWKCYGGKIGFHPAGALLFSQMVLTFFGKDLSLLGEGHEIDVAAPGDFADDLDPASFVTDASSRVVLRDVMAGTLAIHIVADHKGNGFDCEVPVSGACSVWLTTTGCRWTCEHR